MSSAYAVRISVGIALVAHSASQDALEVIRLHILRKFHALSPVSFAYQTAVPTTND